VHVHQDPLLRSTLPAALEDSLNVFILVIASQGKVNPTKDHLGVSDRRVIVPTKAGIRWDSKPALTQYHEVAKCKNDVRIEMNQ
jgi:hypothetical protein